VQSDHSAQQALLCQSLLQYTNSNVGGPLPAHTTPPPPPLSIGRKGSGSLNSSLNAIFHSHSPHQLQESVPEESFPIALSPIPPPIPPRASGATTPIKTHPHPQSQQSLGEMGRPSSASSSASINRRNEQLQMSHIAAAAMIQQRHLIGSDPADAADLQMGFDFLLGAHPQNASTTIARALDQPVKRQETGENSTGAPSESAGNKSETRAGADSPTFMSSPEDDSSAYLKE
jgi:hypothetical protein